ncbi:MAG: SDR family oxidoreductase [Hyphomicrobiaceae bacterium]
MAETRVALVSGANRGIGLEIVRQLARRGVLAALGSRDPGKGAAAADSLRAEGLEVPVIALDVADEGSCRASVAEVQRMFGRLDILVNNAGVFLDRSGGVADLPRETLGETLTVNTLGPLSLIKAAAPVMRTQGYGRIVNLSSGLGQLDQMGTGYAAYRISKTALNALTRIAAGELAQDGIKVNAMCPGWVRTDMGGPNAERDVQKGAETAVWLAMLDDDGPTGGYFRDMRPIAW